MIKEEVATKKKAERAFQDLLKNRNFLLLWVAQILSQTAQQMINYALILQVSTLTNSSTATAGIIVSFTIPAILFAAIAGVFVERNSKKTMLVITNVARGVMVLAYVLTDANWGAGAVLPIFYIVTLLFSAVSQFFNPAELAMIPLIVKHRQLVAANSLFNLSFTACQLVGFVILAPLLLGTVLHNDYARLYLILFGLYIVCAVVTYFLPADDDQPTAAARRQRGEKVGVSAVASGAGEIARSGIQSAKDELIEGWAFIRRDPVIMSAIIYWSIAITVFMMLGTIGPGFLKNVLEVDPAQLYYILMPGGLGLVVGVIFVSRVSTPSNRQVMINIALFLAGAVLLVFALIEPLTRGLFSLANKQPPATLMLMLLGVMTFLLGLLNSFIGVPAQTALQERTPEELRARVFSVFFTVSNVILIVPVLIAGTLADWIGYPQTVSLIAVAVLSVAGIGLYRIHKRGPEPPPSHGRITTEEVESALSAASPGAQPLPTISGHGTREK
jgi:MFS family permease